MDVARCEDGTPFMVLEFLQGSDLRQLLENGPLPIARATALVLQAADAIAEAHANGLIHRDLKPDNLFLTQDPHGCDVLKVIDFGISKSLVNKSKYKTRSENYLGSPQYMSPEQICSARSVDERTDIWALGVVLYELLTGCAPFYGATLPAVCASVLKQAPVPARKLRKDIPVELERIIRTCLSKSPKRRFASANDLIDALQRAYEVVSARGFSTEPMTLRSGTLPRRWRPPAAVGPGPVREAKRSAASTRSPSTRSATW